MLEFEPGKNKGGSGGLGEGREGSEGVEEEGKWVSASGRWMG